MVQSSEDEIQGGQRGSVRSQAQPAVPMSSNRSLDAATTLSVQTEYLRNLRDRVAVLSRKVAAVPAVDEGLQLSLKRAEQEREVAQSAADARLRVLEEQNAAIDGYRRTRVASRVRR